MLSTWTVLLSTITFFMSGNFHPSAQFIGKLQAANNTNFPDCGYRDPSRFCLNKDYSLTSTEFFLILVLKAPLYHLPQVLLVVLEAPL